MTDTYRRYPLSELTLEAISKEAYRALLLHGPNSMLSEELDNGKRLAILMEEVGEVAHEITYDSAADKVKLERELIQVAAAAASWIEVLNANS